MIVGLSNDEPDDTKLGAVKIPLTVFAFAGGALAIGLGFGTQTLLKNFVSGVIILFERPFRVGDVLDVGGQRGTITGIGLRSSVLQLWDGTETLIPNSALLENNLTNWTYTNRAVRFTIAVGVAYGSDTRRVLQVLTDLAGQHGLVEKHPKPQLEVHAFGRGHTLVNGLPVTNWDGALPRNLFFFFMDHPLVTRDEIFETFWPELSVKDATNVFHVTKRKITERLSMKVSETGNYELTHYNSGFYMPSDKIVRHYDVADFQEAVDKSQVASSEKEEVALLSRAIDIYKAPFLQTVEMKWVVERRLQLRQLYAQALIGMGRIYKRRSEDQRAIGFFTRALKETPEREDIHRQVMGLYQNMDLLDDAVIQYRKLEQILGDTLKIAPSRETRELYETIEARRR